MTGVVGPHPHKLQTKFPSPGNKYQECRSSKRWSWYLQWKDQLFSETCHAYVTIMTWHLTWLLLSIIEGSSGTSTTSLRSPTQQTWMRVQNCGTNLSHTFLNFWKTTRACVSDAGTSENCMQVWLVSHQVSLHKYYFLPLSHTIKAISHCWAHTSTVLFVDSQISLPL